MSTIQASPVSEAFQWRDSKRYLWLLSPLLPILGFLSVALFYLSGYSVFAWGGPILMYAVIPLFDRLIGTDSSNPPEAAVEHLENDAYYRLIVYAYIPAQFAMTILGAWVFMTGDLSGWTILGLALTCGTINGVAINTAHELGHKKESLDRWLSKLTLAPVAYGHFYVEHNRGHHKNVATPEDPASSRMGESFWAFLPRTMVGSLRSAWAIEKQRLERKGKSVWALENDNLQAWAMTAVLFGGLAVWLGPWALSFLFVQAFFGASLLEVINYIEHYGLLRQKMANGRYERCAPRHSWNSNHVVTNLVLYQLQRHSDHHANPTRRFQALRHFDESPQLPSGYASMLMLAYVPWLWFRVMDPLVVAHHNGDISKAHLHAPKREALLARWQHGQTLPEREAEHGGADAATTPPATAEASRYECTDCGYIYDEAEGCPREGYAPGTPWAALPDDWPCPDCAVREKPDFKPAKAA